MTDYLAGQANLPLDKYQALDFTNDCGHLCGKILSNLGVNVIKVEPPGGENSRWVNHSHYGDVNPKKSIPWWAFNSGKRSITLDYEFKDKELIKDLVRKSDFVLESFEPEYLTNIGLGYADLSLINSRLIMVSITGFGQIGPYSKYKSPDLVCMAMGGNMNLTGDPDRPPLRPSIPQAYCHASADAAAGALMALWHREQSGQGQHVDVSAQESVVWQGFHNYIMWDFQRINLKRNGAYSEIPQIGRIPHIFPCKDGLVYLVIAIGEMGRATKSLVDWMTEEDQADDDLKKTNWTENGLGVMFAGDTLEIISERIDKFRSFVQLKTKSELFQQAIKRGFLLAPVNSIDDVLSDIQLSSRNFWIKGSLDATNVEISYPGFPCITDSPMYNKVSRPPLIGENNKDIADYLHHESQPSENNHNNRNEIFKGLNILDFSRWVVGPRTTRYFGDHGATVIKVESPTNPGGGRLNAPFKENKIGVNNSAWFGLYNVNKYGMSLDLSKPGSVEIIKKLINWADIFIEAFRPGVMRKYRLDYESVKNLNPRLIYASTSMMGQTGPNRNYGGFGYQLAAISGFDDLTGWPDRTPSGVFYAYTDNIAPPFLVSTIIAALLSRKITGKGQFIDQSQYESALQFIAPTLIDKIINGMTPTRNGNRDNQSVPHGAYRCLGVDRYCVIAISNQDEWQKLCFALDSPTWVFDPRFSNFQNRKKHEDELDKLIESWTINRYAENIQESLQAMGIAAGVIKNAEDMHHDSQLNFRNHFLNYPHPMIGYHNVDALPFRFSKTPAKQYLSAPCLGEHNSFVCTNILGISDIEFVEHLKSGVFGYI